MNEICKPDICTGCSACADICPKGCILMREDSLGAMHPSIDESLCVDCGSCQRVCPSLNTDNKNPRAEKVYAAWSKDEETRRTSASGGIAAELYKHALANGIVSFGVTYDRERGAHFIEVKTTEDILCVKNSKYVYSNVQGVYKTVKNYLIDGNRVLFIGLPCQVAALRKYVGKLDSNLYCVDIICHGVAPAIYLQQHVAHIEMKKHKTTDALSFRDPLFNTHTYTFTLKNNGQVFYKNKVKSRDIYQLGFHRSLIYRENCYHCLFACAERVGDMTIGDYSGLGKMGGYVGEYDNVSGVLLNSSKGVELKNELESNVVFIQRPSEEIFKYEKQLNRPSKSHVKRYLFIAEYNKSRDFVSSAHKALKKDILDITIHRGEWGAIIKDVLRQLIPHSLLEARRQKRNTQNVK